MTSPRLLFVAILLVVPGLAAFAEPGGKLDYSDILRQVADLERLPYLEEGVVSRQFSSYHRGSRYDRETGQCVGMDINGDAGHYLTVHAGADALAALRELEIPSTEPRFRFGDLQWVLDPLERNQVVFLPAPGVESPRTRPPEGIVATIPGPGCIYRIWSANPMGTMRLYLDGGTEPLELDFKGIFLGGVEDPSSSGYRLGLDYFGWSRIVVEGAIEGETAEIADVRDGRFVEQKLGDRFSGGEHLWFHPTKVGASFVWPLKVMEAGRYRLAAYFTRSWDYAVVKVSLDGRALAEVDTYAPQVEWGGRTDLGVVDLGPGKGALRFEVAGRNERSAGILMGVDCIPLEKE